MQLVLVLVSTALLVQTHAFIWFSPKSSQLPENVTEDCVSLRLNHKRRYDLRTFELRYLENAEFYAPGGPVIVFVGGQQSLQPEYLSEGPIYDLAMEKGAYMYYPELRYFGKSRPFKKLSPENLKYNTIENQVEDLAEFIKIIQKRVPRSKILLVGVSYAGALASWLRRLYPNLSVGAWASSAVLEAAATVPQFAEEAGENFRRVGGDECYNKIEKGFATIEVQIWANQTHEIEEAFNTCGEFQTEDDINLLSHFLLNAFLAYAVQPYEFIQTRCDALASIENPIAAIALALEPFLDRQNCFDISYKQFVKNLKDPLSGDDARVQLHLACTEYGWFPTLESSESQPFGARPNIEFYTKLCQEVFGEKVTEKTFKANAKRINSKYGGQSAKVSNTLFTSGEFDPLRGLGPTVNSTLVHEIKGATHGNDILYYEYMDAEENEKFRSLLSETVEKWIQGKK